MSHSSILGGDAAATRASGRDTDALGPSDSSDTGSDVQGERMMPTGGDDLDELGSVPVELGSDSDSAGTGERGAAAGDDALDGADILPDHIVGDEAVDSDDIADAGSSEGLDGIEDDIDDDDDDIAEDGDDAIDGAATDAAVGHAAAAGDYGAGGGGGPGHGRTFRLPAGTLDDTDEQP